MKGALGARLTFSCLCGFGAAVAGSGAARAQDASEVAAGYLARAHAHNDYERARPLFDAVERGFASVEVDIVLRGGELYVAHDEAGVRPGVTLRSLYLDPLRALAQRNGGRVHADPAPALQLLVDVKTDSTATYRVLDETLSAYPDLFTSWTADGVRHGPLVAVISGNRAHSALRADPSSYAAVDGRLEDDRSGWSTAAMPLVSVDWEDLEPADPVGRLATARDIVARLHREGRKVRFWGTPDDEALWRLLLDIGVDYIGTDDAGRLERLLRAQR